MEAAGEPGKRYTSLSRLIALPIRLPQRTPTRETSRAVAVCRKQWKYDSVLQGGVSQTVRRKWRRDSRSRQGSSQEGSGTSRHGVRRTRPRRPTRRFVPEDLFYFFFPPTHNLRPFWLFPLMQILQPRPDPAYVLSHSGARRADRTCNSYPFEGITFEGLASNTNVETTDCRSGIICK